VPTAPLPVVLIRLAGYVAFALFAGVAAFVLLCAPDSSRDPTLQLLVRGGLLGGAVAAILVQGPLHRRGLDETGFGHAAPTGDPADPFGTAMMWRLALLAFSACCD
jgi:copper transport protein